ncbi:MAG TPA: AsmA family protein, partial [Candidatus Binatia bacterium]|nr:AsmA family protein [Candidatus Binatia bacterium]
MPKKRRSWLRLLSWIAGVAVILVVVVYFIATSSAFLRGVILPRVSAAIHADVTVSGASIHPFKQVVLRDLKVQAKGQAPLVTAPEVRLSYSLFDIIGGNIHVDEIALVSPTVELVENPDGSNNLDPILKALQAKPETPKPAQPPAKPGKPVQIDLRKLTLSNVTLLKVKNYAGGNRDVMEVTNLNVTLSNVKNGQTGSLEVSATARVDNNPPAPGTNGLLEATLKGSFNFALTADLKPGSAKGGLQLNVAQAAGAFGQFSALGAALNCDVTPTDIKEVALQFSRGGAMLGELRVSGPFDAEKMEGNLSVALSHLDKQVLNLAGAGSGLDFGPTTINSTNQIQLSKGGANIMATGGLNVNQLQLTRAGQTTPTLDFHTTYDVALDRTAQTASLRQLNLAATQNGSPLLSAQLSEPMNLSLG